ncbi:MAG: 1-acyl-sn-glycerol-3-phosphate acyltransferase [Muribaculaceae bacterium]|nr:1-acyl-sn-glycerol-3-phosphate acyltransferase [Muribaculaceae bacterium]
MVIPQEFSDICPIEDKDFHNEMTLLVQEPGFRHIVNMVMPEAKYSQLKPLLLSLNTKQEFQVKVMRPFMEGLLAKTRTQLTSSGLENVSKDKAYTYITNHRDIVMDSAQLGYTLLNDGFDACEIAIGNNLLIYDWIKKLVRLNKCFIVKRNLGRLETLAAAIQLSKYIHFTLTEKNASIWIAQREGRCKDSNDRTQESLIKMLAIGDRSKTFLENLKELNLTPAALSYEYDPNDYLKAKEFLMKTKNPNFKKSPDDDLISMKTGISDYKGHVHVAFTPCINDQLDRIPEDLDRLLALQRVCNIIDNAIHSNYKIFKTNYMAHDMLFGKDEFAHEYTAEEKAGFTEYLNSQIGKTDIKLSDMDRNYMFKTMLEMYSNPLTNQIEALG